MVDEVHQQMSELEKLREEVIIAAKAWAEEEGDEDELLDCLMDAVTDLNDYETRQNGH